MRSNTQIVTNPLSSIKRFLGNRDQAGISLLVFLTCLFVYLASQPPISAELTAGTIPHSLLAFNWLEHHTLYLDAFQDGAGAAANPACWQCQSHILVETANGHLTSIAPIGTSIVTFPLYGLFYLWSRLAGPIQEWSLGVPQSVPSLTGSGAHLMQLHYEQLAAAIATALSVALFYLAVRLKFTPANSLIATFIYGFATSTWVNTADGVKPPLIANLVAIAMLLSVLKVNRTTGYRRCIGLLSAGIFCGLLPGIFLPSGLLAIATLLYVIFIYRLAAVWLLLGSGSWLLSASWNGYFFGLNPSSLLLGGEARQLPSLAAQPPLVALQHAIESGLALLVSPNFGLFVFSPILLVALLAIQPVVKLRIGRDEQLILSLTLATAVLALLAVLGTEWVDSAYGPQALTPLLPILCFLIPYFVVYQIETPYQKTGRLLTGVSVLFLALTLFSTSVQVAGIFGRTMWSNVPVAISAQPSRIWQLQDNQIQRHATSLYYRLNHGITNPKAYRQGLGGIVTQINQPTGQPLPASVSADRPLMLQAALRNTGSSQWYGYETGVTNGQTQVRVTFLAADGAEVKVAAQNTLYVSGTPQAGDTATAIGAVTFPPKAGVYTLAFDLVAQEIGRFPRPVGYTPYTVRVTVRDR